MVLFKILTALLASIALVTARDASKLMRTFPTISNSLVNLGKMEISIHLNGPTPTVPEFAPRHDHGMQFLGPSKEAEHACACFDYKPSGSSFLNNPTEIINKILKSNDLFKDPTSSVCCDSHENLQESTVFVELIPNHNQNTNIKRSLPPIFHFPHLDKLFKPTASKTKQVEILLFPKRKDMINFEFPSFVPRKKDNRSKNDFQAIGDLEIGSQSASVKKDLALSEKQNNQNVRDENAQTVTPANNSATNNNTL